MPQQAPRTEAKVSTEIEKANKADLTDDADVADKAVATVDIKLDNLDKVNEANEIVKAAEVDNSDKAIEMMLMKRKRPLHLTRPLVPMSSRLTRLICPL